MSRLDPVIAPAPWKYYEPIAVTSGESKGRKGHIIRPCDWRFGLQPQWYVVLDGERLERIIRQDYLRTLDKSEVS